MKVGTVSATCREHPLSPGSASTKPVGSPPRETRRCRSPQYRSRPGSSAKGCPARTATTSASSRGAGRTARGRPRSAGSRRPRPEVRQGRAPGAFRQRLPPFGGSWRTRTARPGALPPSTGRSGGRMTAETPSGAPIVSRRVDRAASNGPAVEMMPRARAHVRGAAGGTHRRHGSLRGAEDQRTAEEPSQAPEAVTDGRGGWAQPVRGAADMSLLPQRLEEAKRFRSVRQS